MIDPDDYLGIPLLIATIIFGPWWYFQSRQRSRELKRYQAAFEFSPTPQFIKDQNFLIVAVNKSFTDAFGIRMEDYAGLNKQQQIALFAASPRVYFDNMDAMAIQSEGAVHTTELLIPPFPARSTLPNPGMPHEFFVAKRRFPIRHGIRGIEYGLIGSATNIEMILSYAEHVREKADALQHQSPMMQAVDEATRAMQGRIMELLERLETNERRFGALERRVDPQGTLKDEVEFSAFEDHTTHFGAAETRIKP